MPIEPVPQAQRQGAHPLLWCTLAAALLLATVLLLPAGATHAQSAGGDPPAAAAPGSGNGNGSGSGSGTASFGSATPSDQFVQSFQQQVSQQLQAALTQSNQLQESRLHQFEQQQHELSEQLQALQQSVDGGGQGNAENRSPGGHGPAEEGASAPQVNVRRAAAPEAAEPAFGAGGGIPPAALGALLPGIAPGSNAGLPGEVASPGADAGHAGSANADPTGGLRTAAAWKPVRAGEPNIAPHGFVEGRLLNGVVAIVGGPDRESIVALSGPYQSANGFVDDLDGCFALVQGKPEIAAGRVDFKLSRLTCNFPDGASRTWDTAGWLVDADGIRGVRATIVENVGRKAAVAAASGALGGIGQRLSQEQYQINSISGGVTAGGIGAVGTTSTFTGSAGSDVLGGAASGAANALGQSISDYYNLYSPSLQVGGGTPVTVVLANDLRLPPSGRQISQTHSASP